MNKGKKMYVRLCEGLTDYGKLIPQSENIYKYIKDTKKDYYTSVYLYNENQKKQFDQKKTVAGITDVVTNQLIFDFDSSDVELARKDAVIVLDRLANYDISEADLNIYFSGGKGFHIVLDTDRTFTPKQAKNAALKIAKGLKSFDSVVYNSNRILRVAHTKHQGSGLFKTDLSAQELRDMSIDQIKELASEEYDPEETTKFHLNDAVYDNLFSEEEKKEETSERDKLLFGDLNLNKKPKFLSPWKYALEQGFFPSGQRSYALMVLASTYKGLGYSETKCYYSLKAAADLQAQRFNQDKFSKEEIYKNIISQVYGQNWNGGTYAEDNFPEQLKEYLTELGVPRQNETDVHENYVVDITKGFDSFREYAENIDANTMKFGIPDLDNALKVQVGHLIGVLAGPGIGKCLAKDTPVMLSNGSIVPVQDIKVGDKLMGDDSTPRNVLSLARGQETMYRVTPTKGDSYVVNESHILSLKFRCKKSYSGFKENEIVNISIKEYLDLPKSTRTKLKGYRVPVNFTEKEVKYDPYMIGLWLGDGTRTKPEITNQEKIIGDYIENFCKKERLKYSKRPDRNTFTHCITTERGQENPFLNETRTCLYNGEKRIPEVYLKNSRENRLKLLAGLIDTDGYLTSSCYEYCTKDKQLKEDFLFLCRSLGLAAYCSNKIVNEKLYYRINISGDLSIVPVKLPQRKASPRKQIKDVLVTGITVEKLEKDEYYGFEIDGNSLFLLGDFTVTHNTSMALTLLNNTSKEGVKSFFGSYDMAGNILIQKLLQRETRLTSEEIYDVYRNNDIEQITNFSKILKKNYANVSFCFKAGQTVEELRESIKKEELKSGEDIKLVIVDYLELIRTKSSDPTIASAEAIQGLREIANEGKVVVCLLQPNKMSSKPDEPLLSYNAAKGSSAIAQAVTAMITCHRAGYSSETPENDVYFSINIVKNRMGALSQVDFSWDGPTGRIGQLEDIQKQDLAELRAQKKLNEEI